MSWDTRDRQDFPDLIATENDPETAAHHQCLCSLTVRLILTSSMSVLLQLGCPESALWSQGEVC